MDGGGGLKSEDLIISRVFIAKDDSEFYASSISRTKENHPG